MEIKVFVWLYFWRYVGAEKTQLCYSVILCIFVAVQHCTNEFLFLVWDGDI